MKNVVTKTLALIVTLSMLLTFIPAVFAGAADVMHIASKEDFDAFVAAGASTDAILDVDIDLGTVTPVFSGYATDATSGYSGVFDGNGHSITYAITGPATGKGLFGALAADAVIKNLTVNGTITITAASRQFIGSIVGYNFGTIENCISNVNISSTKTNSKNIGGIVGVNIAPGIVRDCVNNGTLGELGGYVGGIIGENRGGCLYGCENNGVIIANMVAANFAGGIVGQITAKQNGDIITIEKSVNKGSVTATSNNGSTVGGIVGQINISSTHVTGGAKVNILGCASFGELSADTADAVIGQNKSDVYGLTPVIEAGAPAHEHTYDYENGIVNRLSCAQAEVTYTCTSCEADVEGHTITEIVAGEYHISGAWESDGDTYVKKCTACGTILVTDTTGAVASLNEAVQSLQKSWFRLIPVYGKDVNVCEMLENKLSETFSGIHVALKSADNPASGLASIDADGTLHYFYADPAASRFLWTENIPVVFTLEKGGETVEYAPASPVLVRWDAAKVQQAMETAVVSRVTAETIKGNNASLDEVTDDLVLYKTVNGENGSRIGWTLISWESSAPDVIAVDDSAQSSSDTLFAPYIGRVKRGMRDTDVTLTATFTFQRTDATTNEAPITITKDYAVTVKGVGDDVKAEMQAALDANYLAEKLTYIGTKERIDPAAVKDDVQLLLPRTSGIPNNANYRFEVASQNEAVATVSAYRLNVYRPLPGEAPVDVTLTVKMIHRDYSDIYVTKDITLTIAPIEQSEIDAQIVLMEKVKAAFFEGLNDGANESIDKVVNNLHPFYEAIDDGNGGIKWIYTNAAATGTGIAAVSIDPNHPSEQWDRFQSDEPSVISNETLLVTPDKENTVVTVYAMLSSTQFERYGELYPEKPDFDKLYRQEVWAKITVPGTDPTEASAPVEDETQDETENKDLCKFCHREHKGFWGKIQGFFHKIFYFFAHLFGKR
ncbi:MAG: hypothetical protein IJ766_05890 [Clostridia bacterium]|nr:hypothetical protein [Clostridia bacterium]